MKRLLLVILLFVGAAAGETPFKKDIVSPNGAYSFEIGSNVQIVDKSGAQVILLQASPGVIQKAAGKWSPDSDRVVVVTEYPRGGAMYAVIHNDTGWHKAAVQVDNVFPADEIARAAGVSGFVRIQHDYVGHWLDDHRVTMIGTAKYSGSTELVQYGYTLVFSDGPATATTPAGYERGLVKAVDWHVNK